MRSTDHAGRRAYLAVGMIFGLGVLVLHGCDAGPEDGGTGAIPPATSINAMMVGLVDHAAHHIWDLAEEGMAPETDREWDEVVHASVQLIAAGTAISTGGTGVMDEGWVQEPGWQAYARALMDAGVSALDAANRRDVEAVLRAGDPLVEACEGCHALYKPDSPTEGILHPHYDEP